MNNAKPVYLTEEGLVALQDELDKLLNVKRPALAARLHAAIKQGDLSENADYITAKEEQGFLEGRILELQGAIRNAQLIEDNHSIDGRVGLGGHVTVLEEGEEEAETYHIVGSTEADPRLGKISYESPLGRALLDHREGDVVTVLAPAGKIVFHILAVT